MDQTHYKLFWTTSLKWVKNSNKTFWIGKLSEESTVIL